SIPAGESYAVSTVPALEEVIDAEYRQGFLVLHPLRFWLIVKEHMEQDAEEVLGRTTTLDEPQKSRIRTIMATTANVELALEKIRNLATDEKCRADLDLVAGTLAQRYTGS